MPLCVVIPCKVVSAGHYSKKALMTVFLENNIKQKCYDR